VKYAWIKQHRDLFSVSVMCRVMNVSPSGYYQSLKAEPSQRTQRSETIKANVRHVYDSSRGIYGSCKIAEVLKENEEMESACRNTVARAMREMGLKSRVSKRFKPVTTVTDPRRQPAPNVLDQDFTADAPNQKWVADTR